MAQPQRDTYQTQNSAARYRTTPDNRRNLSVPQGKSDQPSPTTDDRFRNQQANYDSIKRSLDIKKQRQQTEESVQDFETAQQQAQTNDRGNVRQGIKVARALNKIKKPKARATVKQVKRRVRALRAAWATVYPGAWIAAFILCFYLIGMFGLGTATLGESFFNWIPIFGDDLAAIAGKPGQWIFGIAWIISAVVGGLATILCAVWFAVNRVRWWKNGVLLFVFMASFALSIAPIANFAPWYFFFVGMVALTYR